MGSCAKMWEGSVWKWKWITWLWWRKGLHTLSAYPWYFIITYVIHFQAKSCWMAISGRSVIPAVLSLGQGCGLTMKWGPWISCRPSPLTFKLGQWECISIAHCLSRYHRQSPGPLSCAFSTKKQKMITHNQTSHTPRCLKQEHFQPLRVITGLFLPLYTTINTKQASLHMLRPFPHLSFI